MYSFAVLDWFRARNLSLIYQHTVMYSGTDLECISVLCISSARKRHSHIY